MSCNPCNNIFNPCNISHLTLCKSVNSATYSAVGQTIIYSFTLVNTGSLLITQITVSDNHLGFIGNVPSLSPRGSTILTFSYKITQADLDNGSITNIATATSINPYTVARSNTITIRARQNSAFSFTKSVNPNTYTNIGDVLTYTYAVTNTGNVTLPGPFIVTDSILPSIPIISGPLVPGQTKTTTAVYTVIPTDLQAGSIVNQATVTEMSTGQTKIATATATYIFTPFSVVFTGGTGTFPVPLGANSFDAFLIGAGGAGGMSTLLVSAGGGGGAGGNLSISSLLAGITSLGYSVGAGGAGVSGVGMDGMDGSPSTLVWGSNTTSAQGGHGGHGGNLAVGGDGGASLNDGGGGGGASTLFSGLGGGSSTNPGLSGNTLLGGSGGTGSASNFNPIFSNIAGVGGNGGIFGGGGGGGGVEASDSTIRGGNPEPSFPLNPSNGIGGSGYGAGGGAVGMVVPSPVVSGAGANGVIVVFFHL